MALVYPSWHVAFTHNLTTMYHLTFETVDVEAGDAIWSFSRVVELSNQNLTPLWYHLNSVSAGKSEREPITSDFLRIIVFIPSELGHSSLSFF